MTTTPERPVHVDPLYPLITATELHELIAAAPEGLRILDVRWKLGQADGREQHRAGHIPGAVYVDLETDLAAHGEPTDGRHPLPDERSFEQAARSWGINNGDALVMYDDVSGLSAARAWWLFRHAGFSNVRVLNGGLSAWNAAGFATESGDVSPATGTATIAFGVMPTVSIDQVVDASVTGVVLDARAPERFRGEVEPIDPRAGHIPGAQNVPATALLAADGWFLSPDELRGLFELRGVIPGADVVVYCGSGVTASAEILALELAGLAGSLYPGSFSQWSNHAEREVALGE